MKGTLRRRRAQVALVAVCIGATTTSFAGASLAAPHNVFYLALEVGQCELAHSGVGGPGHKLVTVVPCSDPSHTLETYAVVHGGWGHATPPGHPRADTIARSICFGNFERRFGHAIPAGYGYQYFFPDPGAETAKYGDRFICGLRHWPAYAAMGAGTHFR